MTETIEQIKTIGSAGNRKKILFACVPLDGHFHPLTGLAMHLKNKGHDVRWYAGKAYLNKLKNLDIPSYPMNRALDLSSAHLDELFPARRQVKSQVGKIKFDLEEVFIKRGPEYFSDIKTIYNSFPFDLMIADVAFTAIPFVKEKMRIPVISVDVVPLIETSRDVAPAALGLTPAKSFAGKLKQRLLHLVADQLIFRQPNRVFRQLLEKEGIETTKGKNLFDTLIEKSSVLLQSGTSGFEYQRSDMSQNVHFLGPLLPFSRGSVNTAPFLSKMKAYSKVILVTQGTVERDVSKLIVPALDAFKNTNYLIVVTTGGAQTDKLRQQYPFDNCIIEDYIAFNDIMPYADVFVSNGGYGGVLLSIGNRLPMVVSGLHEGKNEICARVGYFRLGINLKTETPKSDQIKSAVEKVLREKQYVQNVNRLADEFNEYDPLTRCEYFVNMLTDTKNKSLANA